MTVALFWESVAREVAECRGRVLRIQVIPLQDRPGEKLREGSADAGAT